MEKLVEAIKNISHAKMKKHFYFLSYFFAAVFNFPRKKKLIKEHGSCYVTTCIDFGFQIRFSSVTLYEKIYATSITVANCKTHIKVAYKATISGCAFLR